MTLGITPPGTEMKPNTEETPEGELQSASCSPSGRKYENRGGEIWEWDGQKWRELFPSDAIQRLEYYERKIASMGIQRSSPRCCFGALSETHKCNSVATKRTKGAPDLVWCDQHAGSGSELIPVT